MTTLDRYIAVNLIRGWLMVFALLAVMFGLFAFIDELNHTQGNYQAAQALVFVLKTTPQRVFELFPVVTLLGTLIAFAFLARSSELVVILTSGISATRLLFSAGLPGFILMFLLWPFGEFVAAPLYQKSEAVRQEQRTGHPSTTRNIDLWSTNNGRYFHVGKVMRDDQLADIQIYDIDQDGNLTEALLAPRAKTAKSEKWILSDVIKKEAFLDPTNGHRRLNTELSPALQSNAAWTQDELRSLTLTPASMSLHNLYNHLRYLSSTGQNIGNLPHLLWQKAVLPISAAAMVLLALQLSRGMIRQRSHSFGASIGIGVAIGIGFYLASQVIYALGVLMQLNAMLVAALPILVVLGVSSYLHTHQP